VSQFWHGPPLNNINNGFVKVLVIAFSFLIIIIPLNSPVGFGPWVAGLRKGP
jgi:hypothetical protein